MEICLLLDRQTDEQAEVEERSRVQRVFVGQISHLLQIISQEDLSIVFLCTNISSNVSSPFASRYYSIQIISKQGCGWFKRLRKNVFCCRQDEASWAPVQGSVWIPRVQSIHPTCPACPSPTVSDTKR